jgi:hypothetical protein
MQIVTVKISEIQENKNNPRFIRDKNFKKLVSSVKEFPEMLNIRPIVVNKDMTILGGNMRFKACLEAGLKEIPIIIANNLTEEQEKEFLIKDNVSGGEWDWDVLANEWDSELLNHWGVETFESSDINLDDFFEENGDSEKEQKFKIVLEYTEEDFAEISELFKKHSGTKEEIVFNLLSK